MKEKIKILIVTFIVAIMAVGILTVFFTKKSNEELQTITSEKQLLDLYNKSYYSKSYDDDFFKQIFSMPFTAILNARRKYVTNSILKRSDYSLNTDSISPSTMTGKSAISDGAFESTTSSKEYSTTNIQVENVDEADITKTDGNYIYSISGYDTVITNVTNPKTPVISTKISGRNGSYPEDLILYNNKLVVISKYTDSVNDTIVSIYDITTKESPELIKGFQIKEPYYTSRCINNNLYVISSGYLKKDDKGIDRDYIEDGQTKQIELNNIKYMKEIDTHRQTIFSNVDLDNLNKDINIKSYLIDISNAYVSENSFYLLDKEYEYNYKNSPSIKSLFGLKGAIGFFHEMDNYDYYSDSGYKTKIYKFDIKENGDINYSAKTKVDGQTINQYSLDEKEGHLRVALYDNKGSRVHIFDEKLNEIGKTENLAKGEKMYSSRFIGDRAYLVTYKTIDPLFVIDLSDEKNPKVLGELKIPGYSTYLHPYDENHLIGIGMETKERINRNINGTVTSTSATIVGMKMALFDISNVNNPKQISSTVIGDSRTTSAILTNPKALLFSKEKQLIAIPVNHYATDFQLNSSSDTYSSVISSYKNKSTNYIGEGYLVYNLNLEQGFKYKGLIAHENVKTNNKYSYSYSYTTKLLRGMYIENNLYTVSENALKVNALDTLDLISELKIKGE